MASIRQEILIEATPEQVWAAVRDVGAVHRRLVPGYIVDTRFDGDTRILTLPSGGVVRELIVDVDDEARRLPYAVVEGRMPIVHHHASFQVFAKGASHSRLVWITDVLPNELAAEIRMRVERGAVVMKQTLEEEARRS
jgi:carbon monoxide dehydrogenase subunit G